MPTTAVIIVAAVVVLLVFVALLWGAPDASPARAPCASCAWAVCGRACRRAGSARASAASSPRPKAPPRIDAAQRSGRRRARRRDDGPDEGRVHEARPDAVVRQRRHRPRSSAPRCRRCRRRRRRWTSRWCATSPRASWASRSSAPSPASTTSRWRRRRSARCTARTLPTGEEVVVKIQYPGVADAIRADLANVAMLLSHDRAALPGARPASRSSTSCAARIIEELDYAREAEQPARVRRAYEDHPFIRVPRVFASHSTARVLTTEFVAGRRFDDVLRSTPASARYGRDHLSLRLRIDHPLRRLQRRSAPRQLPVRRRTARRRSSTSAA